MTPSERYRRVSRILIAVCGLNEEKRAKALDRLCRDCADIRAEVEVLLKYHDRASRSAARPRTPYLPS